MYQVCGRSSRFVRLDLTLKLNTKGFSSGTPRTTCNYFILTEIRFNLYFLSYFIVRITVFFKLKKCLHKSLPERRPSCRKTLQCRKTWRLTGTVSALLKASFIPSVVSYSTFTFVTPFFDQLLFNLLFNKCYCLSINIWGRLCSLMLRATDSKQWWWPKSIGKRWSKVCKRWNISLKLPLFTVIRRSFIRAKTKIMCNKAKTLILLYLL